MKIYFAPMEGITGYIFRNTYHRIYGQVDKYFAPFISPSAKAPLTARDLRDLDPENNVGIDLVPQILACDADRFIEALRELESMGYKEVNLNLGCPSGTVCSKGKGAGFLPETRKLQAFLHDIYSRCSGVKISIKTRLGYFDPEEFYDLVDIFNEFPVSELIVHPRIRGDFYKGEIRSEYYAYALEHVNCPLVYNGNIFSTEDYESLESSFGMLPDPVMLGRGLVGDPSLAGKLKGLSGETDISFRLFHDTLYREYQKIMAPDINVLYKMKELWSYWSPMFEDNGRDIKRLMKAKKYSEYDKIVSSLLSK
ncbi:MAG: tRNA-dihydrouridine synthase family protein [Clostridiales bacterium]|nr:tRNA-dihydrouridine synthase family protein [Clostridiales bacterium]